MPRTKSQPETLTRHNLPTGLGNRSDQDLAEMLAVFGDRACDKGYHMRGAIMLEAARRLGERNGQ
jgi:hypothetical protein